MKICTIQELLEARIIAGEDRLGDHVYSACGSDMMSDVLAYVKDQAVLLTGLVNAQVIRTAEMMDMRCIVFVRSKQPTPEIVELGVGMMRLLAVGYIAFAVTQTWQGVMRGAGETMIPMWISIVTTVIIRMPLAYLWAHLTKSPQWPNGDPVCLYGSLLTAWIAGCLLSTLVYFKGKWRKRTEDALQSDPDERDESIQSA